ncbi:MAG: putative 7-carboxy-7-deazaguanine synthase QueE [Porcipelethomonas sp.]
MAEYFNVAEKFISINGEGTRAGQTAVFIRFTGCNLNCSYCDTKWANEKNAAYIPMTAREIVEYIKSTGIRNVTLTGGEPLIQPGIKSLLELIAGDRDISCEIETNGSVSLRPFAGTDNRPSFTMDYKLPSSGMEKYMCRDNFSLLTPEDTVKFVSGSREDLVCAKEIMDEYELYGRTRLFISPVFGSIDPAEIVEFMISEKLNKVNLQLQLHKIIWSPDMRGV